MTIYILSNEHKETARSLDDKSLDKQIKDIAQVLCNVHHMQSKYACQACDRGFEYEECTCMVDHGIPLPSRLNKDWKFGEWEHWVHECRANYLWLGELGLELIKEFNIRGQVPSLKGLYIMQAIHWARENVPGLPDKDEFFGDQYAIHTYGKITSLPLVMPKKYIIGDCYDTKKKEIFLLSVNNILSYRNYYQAKSQQQIRRSSALDCMCDTWCKKCKNIQWTNRQKPEWITF